MPNSINYQLAVHDFQSARQKAAVQEILARFMGRSTQLLSYEEVAEKLKLRIRTERGLQNIPLDAIVGSVGRYTDFTRTFMPRREIDRQRWASVKAAMQENAGLPPIDVYKVGEVYFVIDGNHRVSIARQEGFKVIEARVIELQTEIKLTPDIQPDDLIVKAEHAEFLNTTRLHEIRPNVDLTVTIPGQYEKLMREICVQEVLLEKERKSNSPLQDSVEAWYDNTYIPLAETIRDRGMVRLFPGRTITDLYIWISENRAALEKELGVEIQSDVAATDLIVERSVRTEPGEWRKSRTVTRYTEHLFMDILVPLSGDPASWDALQQALIIAQREEANIHGLHIVDAKEKVESEPALAVRARFEEACAAANVPGKLVIEAGEVTRKISERATIADLVVLKIMHPPQGGLATLQSPFRTVIVNSARPVLGVPAQATHFERALLAYDGSPRAKEALFVATYLAEMWQAQLLVYTALQGGKINRTVQDDVRRYLDIHEVQAEYLVDESLSKIALWQTAEEHRADLVLMGGYGGSVLREVVIGSVLDTMLREARIPIFICR